MADPLTSEYVQGSYIIRAPPDRAPRREVLKWLQGLDLSHSVRNVRRDAANGYVVAEICSRYFPSDINMHSFENGASLKVKANNWDALVRFCRRAAPGVRLERETAEGCMRMTPGFALELIEKMYTAFTRKTLAPAAPVLAPEGPEPRGRDRAGAPRGGRAGERGRRTRGRRRDGASRSRVGPTSSPREHTDRTTRTRARRRAGVCRGSGASRRRMRARGGGAGGCRRRRARRRSPCASRGSRRCRRRPRRERARGWRWRRSSPSGSGAPRRERRPRREA